MRNNYIEITILGIFVAIVCIIGFSITASYIPARLIKLDGDRIQDFSQINLAVLDYYNRNKQLPKSISSTVYGSEAEPKDPETKKNYIFEIISNTEYKMCTSFSTDSREVDRKHKNANDPDFYKTPDAYNHKKGYDCIKYKLPAESIVASPTPTPKPKFFEVLSPSSKSTLCLGQTYEITWIADSTVEKVENLYLDESVFEGYYLLNLGKNEPKKDIASTNSQWRGNLSWMVGNVFSGTYYDVPTQIKPGVYRLAFNVITSGKTVSRIDSQNFQISECNSPSPNP